ncbi:MAG: site-specific tyrosine recombinase XerD [Bacteroidaceae bacterium]|nr:site-specific tyrosine recombinase XerD [Bacteroidaceae bacterium]
MASEGIQKTIESFRQYLLLEKSLSQNTAQAYLDDTCKLADFMTDAGLEPKDITIDHLHSFVATLADLGIAPRSIARIISGIRQYFKFLVLDGYVEQDPTELLEAPRMGRHLPEVLSVDEIDRIIASVDLSDPLGQRNRCILETLYSCGLRVSELCNLKLSDMYLDQEFIRVSGKGSKERLVPVSGRAIHEIELYLTDRCHIDIKPGFQDFLFLSPRLGKPLSRIMIFDIVRKHTALAGIDKTVSPHTFRHSFATHLLEGGANLRAIQCMLGHEKIATTEIYTHIDRSRLRHEIEEHHPRNMR